MNVENREESGSLRMKRLRISGKIPAVLYGHGLGTVHLQIPTVEVDAAIRHVSQVVELKGAVSESALIKEVQWDAFGTSILHLDLARVDADEAVEVSISVGLVGVSPGTKVGGMVRHQLHELQISCPASRLPEKLELRINSLEIGQSLTAKEVELPEGASLMTPADEIVVQCVEVLEAAEPEAGEGGMAEPEVIGRKAEDGEGGDE